MQELPRISLKAARVNVGLSQREAANRLGISEATLQNYEAGYTIPDILMSRKIEDVYAFPVDFIFLAGIPLKASAIHLKCGRKRDREGVQPMNMEVHVAVSGLQELDQEIDRLMEQSAEFHEAINAFRLRLHQLGLEITQEA